MIANTNIVLAALAALPSIALAHGRGPLALQHPRPRQQQDANSPLYLDEPSCDFYQCAVYWKPGTKTACNWLRAPSDSKVKVDLMTNNSADLAYHIATVDGVSDTCDAGNGFGKKADQTCGGFKFVVPSAWADGNYTMRVSTGDLSSYTDVILIQRNGSTEDVPFNFIGADGSLEANGTDSATGSGSGSSSNASDSSSTQLPTSTTSGDNASSTSSSASTGSVSSTSTPSGAMRGAESGIQLAALGAVSALALAIATLF